MCYCALQILGPSLSLSLLFSPRLEPVTELAVEPKPKNIEFGQTFVTRDRNLRLNATTKCHKWAIRLHASLIHVHFILTNGMR